MPVETEIKLPVSGLERARAAILSLGYGVHHERAHEWNAVFDSRTSDLRGKGQLLRLRRFGNTAILTFKGTTIEGRHKQREEIEVTVSDAGAAALILERLGLGPVFRYEKFRTEYGKPGEEGVITVDETPIGNFLEVEGAPAWIDDVAARLGYGESDYIKLSYGALYIEHCERTGTARGDMLFESKADV
ncbi:MAG: class IV adenylate cyclase [Bryobacteraceae bacterium]|jgi:adenylate cyclase class 2